MFGTNVWVKNGKRNTDIKENDKTYLVYKK